MIREEYATIISIDNKNKARALGISYLIPLELTLRKDKKIENNKVVYVGSSLREEVFSVNSVISYEKIRSVGQDYLRSAVEKHINSNQEKYINFFNLANYFTIRRHSLHLIPQIGDSIFRRILSQREVKKFESFEDFKIRIGLNPVNLISKRILNEINGLEDIFIFTDKNLQ